MSPSASTRPARPLPRLVSVLVLLSQATPLNGLAQPAAPASTSLEPDRAALRAAYAAQVAAVNAGAGEVLGPAEAARVQITLEDLQKLSCRPIEREGVYYDCRVELRIRLPEQRPQTSIVHFWVERTEGGWVVH